MKSMQLPLVAIFFMTYFHGARVGAMAPRPPGSATVCRGNCTLIVLFRA